MAKSHQSNVCPCLALFCAENKANDWNRTQLILLSLYLSARLYVHVRQWVLQMCVTRLFSVYVFCLNRGVDIILSMLVFYNYTTVLTAAHVVVKAYKPTHSDKQVNKLGPCFEMLTNTTRIFYVNITFACSNSQANLVHSCAACLLHIQHAFHKRGSWDTFWSFPVSIKCLTSK